MKFSASGIAYAKHKYSAFGDLRGFPQSEASLEARAEALLRIAHPVVVSKRLTAAQALQRWHEGKDSIFGEHEREVQYPKDHPQPAVYRPSEADWAAEWEEMDAATLTHGTHGTVNPMDWLIELAVDTCTFCPEPPVLRKMFSGPFDCAVKVEVPEFLGSKSEAEGEADGQSSGEIERGRE